MIWGPDMAPTPPARQRPGAAGALLDTGQSDRLLREPTAEFPEVADDTAEREFGAAQ